MTSRRAAPAFLAAALVAAAGLAWPWPADRAPVGSIRGAEASTIRLAYPAPCYRAGGAPEPWGAWTANAASESASWLDRTGAGHSLSEVGSGTGWSTGGWTPGGVGALSIGAALGASDTLLLRVSGCPTTSLSQIAGAYETGKLASLGTGYLGTSRVYAWGSSATVLTGAYSAGVVGIAGGQGYRDGAADGTATSGAMPTRVAWIGGRNASDGAQYGGCTVHWAVRWTSTLTAAQVAAVTAACAGF